MKFVIQRVSSAKVEVNEEVVGEIGNGYFVLIGIEESDTTAVADKLMSKMRGLRIFSDENYKINLSLDSVEGNVLLVSQFTLYADCRKGNRPSFTKAGSPEHAEKLYNYIVEESRKALGDDRVATGVFGEHMKCSLVNEGPFTVILDSKELL